MSFNRHFISKPSSFPSLKISEKEGILLRFLYHTTIGRIFLWFLTRPVFSKIIGIFLSSKISKFYIKPFIRKNNINMDRFQNQKYSSFNDFFIRKIKDMPKASTKKDFISPCDGKLSVYKITKDLTISVKNSKYTISNLINNNKLAQTYEEGYCLIFRLTPDDYHRYHFIDDGTISKTKKIKGILHTVRPIALQNYQVFTENTREVTTMDTINFGSITQIEVGALLVGKIKNHQIKNFSRYEEKGHFLFGGSTIILLVAKNRIKLLKELEKNTKNNLETIVHYQDILGIKN